MKKEYVCISCPIGCHLLLEIDDNKNIAVSGNKCNRGEIYAKEEYSSPKRVVTSTCKFGNIRIPVKTDKTILKEEIKFLLDEIHKLNISLPVKSGDIIIKNFKKTKINVVITRSINN